MPRTQLIARCCSPVQQQEGNSMAETAEKPDKHKGLTTNIARYFGRLPNQDLKAFAAEVGELSDSDKDDLAAGLGEVSKEGASSGSLTY